MDGFPCKSIDQIIGLHVEKYQLNLTLSTACISNRKKRRPFELPMRFSGVSTRTKIGKRTLYWYKDIIRGRDKMHS